MSYYLENRRWNLWKKRQIAIGEVCILAGQIMLDGAETYRVKIRWFVLQMHMERNLPKAITPTGIILTIDSEYPTKTK